MRISATDHRQDVMRVFGNQDAIPHIPVVDQLIQLSAISPRRFVQIVSGQQNSAATQNRRIADDAQRFDHGSHTRLHVARPAPGQTVPLNGRRSERQVHRVQMPVELQRPARFPRIPPHHNGRRCRPRCLRTLHLETLLHKQSRQRIGNGTRFAGGAGNINQSSRRR